MGLELDFDKYNFNEHNELDVNLITIDPSVRAMCKQNACGQYGTNHMCPPAIKSLEDWKDDIFSYKSTIIVTKVYNTKGPYDLKTWMESMEDFQKTLLALKKDVLNKYPEKTILLLGAGACRLCEKCALIDGEDCRLPDEAFPSLEACGIDVMTLSKRVGVKYNNGKNTVTYIGMVLF